MYCWRVSGTASTTFKVHGENFLNETCWSHNKVALYTTSVSGIFTFALLQTKFPYFCHHLKVWATIYFSFVSF